MAPGGRIVTALELVQALLNGLFVLVFALALARAIRRPSRATLDVALFFGAPAVAASQSWVLLVLGIAPSPTASAISGALIMAIPLLTLRVIDGFTTLRRWVIPAAFVGWVASAFALAAAPAPLPRPVTLGLVLYFALFEGYAGFAVARAARRARGVTLRRLQAVAVGTIFLALAILAAGAALFLPVASAMASPLALLSMLSYLIGFSPPAALRRAWQAPDVLDFVRRTSRLAGEADLERALVELAGATAAAIGSGEAMAGMWDPERERMRYSPTRIAPFDRRLEETLSGAAFREQRAVLAADDPRAPRISPELRALGLHFVLAAPMTVGDHRIGVLVALAERQTLFLDEDLALLQLLADQAAVVLEHRRLLDEVRSLNRSLERNVAELTAVNRELASFSYAVSHDLRAPLRSIDGFSQIVLEDKADVLGDDGREHLGRVRAAAWRMGALIDDLLMLSRLTRDDMRSAPIDLAHIARSVAEELRAREPEREVEFTVDGTVQATGDARLLRIALANLLGNAWKFTRDRRPAHIRFGAEAHDGEVVCSVRDDGVGFDAQYTGKLFGAFQRLHSGAEFEGTGIGLATVQRIVHRHGGRVWADGEIGKGATFYFTLPLAEAGAERARA